ncbi:hypothetical protein GS421_13355 [Rhodococcus hoagii]|nr:hypothetical protein [Prescottella equi]
MSVKTSVSIGFERDPPAQSELEDLRSSVAERKRRFLDGTLSNRLGSITNLAVTPDITSPAVSPHVLTSAPTAPASQPATAPAVLPSILAQSRAPVIVPVTVSRVLFSDSPSVSVDSPSVGAASWLVGAGSSPAPPPLNCYEHSEKSDKGNQKTPAASIV